MKTKLDILSIGEILIDFVGKEQSTALMDVTEFRRAAGGGPANVAVGASRLGMKAGFVGKVGADAFGKHLQHILEDNDVNIEGLVVDPSANTTLVFVALNQKGVPDFSFFRTGTADTLLRIEELPVELLQKTKILHFSSVSLTTEPSRSACLKAVEIARNAGALISFDPNLRLPLWANAQSAKEEIMAALKLADILKMNDEEYRFLTGRKFDENETGADFFKNSQLKLLAVTRGEQGSILFNKKDVLCFPGLPVHVVDTTGAGDAFMAGMLSILVKLSGPVMIDWVCMERIGIWASATATLACQRSGGIPSLPDRKGVVELITSIKPDSQI
jgi:fructokinase